MPDALTVTVELTNDKLQFAAVARDNPAIHSDYIPPLGDGQGYLPLEIMLVSLATCAGGTVASLLRKMHKTVCGLTVSARGERRDQHPLSFCRIDLDFCLASPDAGKAEMQRALQLSEETYCPVWAMIKGNVEVHCTFTITAPAGERAPEPA